MLTSLLATAGLFAEPVLEPELHRAIEAERRRVSLLERHAQRVTLEAPAHLAPHQAALARAEAHLAWLERRAREEARLAEWRRANPPSLRTEVRAMLFYLGLGSDPWPGMQDPSAPTLRVADGARRAAAAGAPPRADDLVA